MIGTRSDYNRNQKHYPESVIQRLIVTQMMGAISYNSNFVISVKAYNLNFVISLALEKDKRKETNYRLFGMQFVTKVILGFSR